jgi:AhpD family alkylhydroperoxidase
MSQRFDLGKTAPEGYQAMRGLHAYVAQCGLEPALLELVKVRVSQINGCAFCIAMHVPLARRAGVSDERLHLLAAWREAEAIFDERERAALAWAEALTRLGDPAAIGSVYEAARRQFSEREIADLAFATVEINAWNRLMIAAGARPKIGPG